MSMFRAVASALCCACVSLQAVRDIPVVRQDGSRGPLTVSVGSLAYDRETGQVLCGAGEDAAPGNLAVMELSSQATALRGIAPSRITLDGENDVANPFFAKHIRHLTSFLRHPCLVANDDLSTIYLTLINNARQTRVISHQVKLTDDTPGHVAGLSSLPQRAAKLPRICAAIKPPNEPFGADGSAFDVYIVASQEQGSESEMRRIQRTTIGVDAPSVALGSPVTFERQEPVMYADEDLDQHFEGYCVTSGANPDDGAVAVSCQLGVPIFADEAAIEGDVIVGARGAQTTVCVHHLASLFTSTHLNYLVVIGGVGDPATTQRDVYALPMTHEGRLAAKNAKPVTWYKEDGINKIFLTRGFVTQDAARQSGDLFTPTDDDIYRARVGGNATLPSDITSVYAEKDAVFVATAEDGAGARAGVYYSQARFGSDGRIMGWTDWAPAGGFAEPTHNIFVDTKMARIVGVTRDAAGKPTTVSRTLWTSGTPYAEVISEQFSDSPAGVQGLIDFPRTHPAFDQTQGNRFSCMCATGNGRVVLAESGADDAGIFVPTRTLDPVMTTGNGELVQFAPSAAIAVTGGDVTDLGPIITATIAHDADDSWLCIGGTGGCAILRRPDGRGWQTGTLTGKFQGLSADMAFARFGSFSNVRSLQADGNTLYVLTEDGLTRCELTRERVKDGTPGSGSVLIATPESVFPAVNGLTMFSDVIVDGPLALLATSRGLVATAPDFDVRTQSRPDSRAWQQIALPESPGPVTRLWSVPQVGGQEGIMNSPQGGTVYVLATHSGRGQAHVYRYAVAGTPEGQTPRVTQDTVHRIPDDLIKGSGSPFMVLPDVRNFFSTDGANNLVSRSAYWPRGEDPFVDSVGRQARSGTRGAGRERRQMLAMTSGRVAGPIVQRSATGGWMVAGSQLHVGE